MTCCTSGAPRQDNWMVAASQHERVAVRGGSRARSSGLHPWGHAGWMRWQSQLGPYKARCAVDGVFGTVQDAWPTAWEHRVAQPRNCTVLDQARHPDAGHVHWCCVQGCCRLRGCRARYAAYCRLNRPDVAPHLHVPGSTTGDLNSSKVSDMGPRQRGSQAPRSAVRPTDFPGSQI